MNTVYTLQAPSPLGDLLLAADDQGLRGVWFQGQAHQPPTSGWEAAPTHPILLSTAELLAQYFQGIRRDFAIKLSVQSGTPFQRTVWQALQGIAYGQTCTYAELAQRVGRPLAARAVGAAVARNPWSVVVPCHRVLGSDGQLTGYAGGLARKTALLQREGVL